MLHLDMQGHVGIGQSRGPSHFFCAGSSLCHGSFSVVVHGFSCPMASGILVPRPEIKPGFPA